MTQEEELKVFEGRCGKVLLEYLQRIPQSKIKKMQHKLKKFGMRTEYQPHFKMPEEKNHKESHGPVRTRTGYIYR